VNDIDREAIFDAELEAGRQRADPASNGDDGYDPAAYDALVAGDAPGAEAELLELSVVTLRTFAAVAEAGADPLVGDGDDIVIPADGNVMIYGDGGAGKTTLTIDLACHIAAPANWMGLPIGTASRLLIIENEGPRTLFRRKVERKLAAWLGPPLTDDNLTIVDEPWAKFTFAAESHRRALAAKIAVGLVDIVVVGPLTAAGMNEAGTLRDVRAFMALLDDVRTRAGRPVTFVIIHHENKGGKVSGAWEGAGDTLWHVIGTGRSTRLHMQKVRWSTTWHGKTLDLDWIDGEGFSVNTTPELTDGDIAAKIVELVELNPGIGWTAASDAIPGVRAAHKRTIRDRLLADGRIVNLVNENGRDIVSDRCERGRHTHLFLADDPTIRKLRPDPDEVGTNSSSARVRADPEASAPTSSRRPPVSGDEVWDEVFRGAPAPSARDAAELGATPLEDEP
jgi:hypothetical protein